MTDEVVLNLDGFISVDPSNGVRERCERFIESRTWHRSQIAYADQAEPEGLWSVTLNLGLDHLNESPQDSYEDIDALLGFANDLAGEHHAEITADLRFRSAPWYSGHVAFLEGKPLDSTVLRDLIVRTAATPPRDPDTAPTKKPWWKIW